MVYSSSMIAFGILLSIICSLILPIACQESVFDGLITNIPMTRHVLRNDADYLTRNDHTRTYLDPVQGSAQIGFTIPIWLGTPRQKVTNHDMLLS